MPPFGIHHMHSNRMTCSSGSNPSLQQYYDDCFLRRGDHWAGAIKEHQVRGRGINHQPSLDEEVVDFLFLPNSWVTTRLIDKQDPLGAGE